MDQFATTYRNNFSWDKPKILKRQEKSDDPVDNSDQSNLEPPKTSPDNRTCGNSIDASASRFNEPYNRLYNAKEQNQYGRNWLYTGMMYDPPQTSVGEKEKEDETKEILRTPDGDKQLPTPPVQNNKVAPKENKISVKDLLCHMDDGDKKVAPPLQNNKVPAKERKISMKELLCHVEQNVDINKKETVNSVKTQLEQPKPCINNKKLPSQTVTMKDILYNSEPRETGTCRSNRPSSAHFKRQSPPTTVEYTLHPKMYKCQFDMNNDRKPDSSKLTTVAPSKDICGLCGKWKDSSNVNLPPAYFCQLGVQPPPSRPNGMNCNYQYRPANPYMPMRNQYAPAHYPTH